MEFISLFRKFVKDVVELVVVFICLFVLNKSFMVVFILGYGYLFLRRLGRILGGVGFG